MILNPFVLLYLLYQSLLSFLFNPRRPPKDGQIAKPLGRVAVIGAGLTGVASAAHCVGHGFEVVLFDEKKEIGGIWADVNSTSGLQISSAMFRFFPSVAFKHNYPKREEILENIRYVWESYGLRQRTELETHVESVTRHASSTDPNAGGHARWVINHDTYTYGVFDAVIICVGTCGKPKSLEFPGQDKFKGQVVHSSRLDDVDLSDKDVLVVGGGASGVEAVELAIARRCRKAQLITRSDKWIIPRNFFVDGGLAMINPLGRETALSWVPEQLLKYLFYRDLKDLSPTKGLYQGTPIVNNEFLSHVRRGKAVYKRGDIQEVVEDGVRYVERRRGTEPGDKGIERHVKADVIIVATGFERPTLDFMPGDIFSEEYRRPNMYLQNFSVQDSSVVTPNCAFMDAIGVVGNWHIGIYTRILLLFLMDPDTRPKPRDMRLWVDVVRFVKSRTPGSGLNFFTYSVSVARSYEMRWWLCIWVVSFHFFRLSRLAYLFWTLFGWGFFLPADPVTDGKAALLSGVAARAKDGHLREVRRNKREKEWQKIGEKKHAFHLSSSELVPFKTPPVNEG